MARTRFEKVAQWFGLVGSIVTIGGAAASFLDRPALLAPLGYMVPIPVWVLLAVIAFLPAAVVTAALYLNRPERDLRHNLLQALKERDHFESAAEETQRHYNLLEEQLKVAREKAESSTRELQRYESLENEIIGLLKSGTDFTLSEIGIRTSAGVGRQGQTMALLAIANLGGRVAAVESRTSPTYRISDDSE